MKLKISADLEKAVLDGDIVDPPLREVRRQIQLELGTHLRSHRELDGTIRDATEIYEILCLRKCLKLLPKK